jgi:hypothetical protein
MKTQQQFIKGSKEKSSGLKTDAQENKPSYNNHVNQLDGSSQDFMLEEHDHLRLLSALQYDKSAANKLGTKAMPCFSQALGFCDKELSCLYSHNKDVIHQYQRSMIERIIKSKDFDPEKSLPSGVVLKASLDAKPIKPQFQKFHDNTSYSNQHNQRALKALMSTDAFVSAVENGVDCDKDVSQPDVDLEDMFSGTD